MYHRQIIESKIKLAAQALGFEPVYHSLKETREMVETLDSLVGDEGQLLRSLYPREIKFIRNERAICQCDFRYWMEHYAHIKDKSNIIRLTQPNVAQNIVIDIWAELELQELAIIILALKARQLGVSTITELAVAHRAQFVPGCNAVVGSNDPDKSWEMFQMVELCWEKMPWWLMPEATKNESGKLVEFGKQNSRVSIQHGTQRSGIARGTTPTVAHLSELADYDNPKDLVDAGLMRAMHDSPAVLIVFESTAAGRHNWWHNTWDFAVKHWKDHTSRMCPMFLPWYVGTDLYPTPTWLKAHPVPANWQPAGITENHAERSKAYVRMNPLLRKYLGEKWEMPRAQMWFWEVTREEYREKKNLAKFYQEMPADDSEAFQSTNISVFDAEICSSYNEAIKDTDVEVYGIVGSQADIPLRLQPDRRDIDHAAIEQGRRKVIEVTFESELGHRKDFQFWPLKFNGYTSFNPDGKLFIWEHPEDNEEYGLGVDTGEGIGLDQSVIEVLRKGTSTRNDAQVAEFCLAPDSLVTTPHRVKRIVDVEIGDEVITRLGTRARIVDKHRSTRDFSVNLRTGLSPNIPLHLTADHRVATQEGWVEAGKLKPARGKSGDWLMYPVRPLTETISTPVTIQYRGNGGPKKLCSIPLSRDFGFFCGLYLAEGTVGYHSGTKHVNLVSFTVHEREAKPWKKTLQRSIPDFLLTEHKHSSTKHARNLTVSSVGLGQWIIDNFGRTSEKHVPSWVWDAPRDFIEGLVQGMVAGDGYIDRRCAAVSYTSVLPSLTVALRDLVLSLGWGLGTIRKWNRGAKAQSAWVIQFYGEVGKPFLTDEMIRPLPRTSIRKSSVFRWGWNKKWIYVPVIGVEPATGGEFIDIQVAGNEPSFCVLQAAVHNCSPYINAHDLWPIVLAIGQFYRTHKDGELQQPKAVIECMQNGEVVQHELRKMGWRNFHQWVRYDNKKIRKAAAHKLGWVQTPWARSMMIDTIVKYLRDGWCDINSPWFVDEMRDFERDEDMASIRAMNGGHDDRIISLGIVLFSLHDMEIRGSKSNVAQTRAETRESMDNYATCPPAPGETDTDSPEDYY